MGYQSQLHLLNWVPFFMIKVIIGLPLQGRMIARASIFQMHPLPLCDYSFLSESHYGNITGIKWKNQETKHCSISILEYKGEFLVSQGKKVDQK